MNLFQINYLLLQKEGDKKMVEFVAAPDIGTVWRYYREHIEGENIEFDGIFKLAPIVKILQ